MWVRYLERVVRHIVGDAMQLNELPVHRALPRELLLVKKEYAAQTLHAAESYVRGIFNTPVVAVSPSSNPGSAGQYLAAVDANGNLTVLTTSDFRAQATIALKSPQARVQETIRSSMARMRKSTMIGVSGGAKTRAKSKSRAGSVAKQRQSVAKPRDSVSKPAAGGDVELSEMRRGSKLEGKLEGQNGENGHEAPNGEHKAPQVELKKSDAPETVTVMEPEALVCSMMFSTVRLVDSFLAF